MVAAVPIHNPLSELCAGALPLTPSLVSRLHIGVNELAAMKSDLPNGPVFDEGIEGSKAFRIAEIRMH